MAGKRNGWFIMTLNEYSQEAHKNAVEKGFYQRDRDVPELLMLVITEIAEAVEEDRKIDRDDNFWEEIADVFIRLFDLCGFYGVDIEPYIHDKMEKNKLRPPKHNKRY